MAEAVDSTEVQQPAAAGDEDDRKLFVGGLPQDASQVLQFPQSPIWRQLVYGRIPDQVWIRMFQLGPLIQDPDPAKPNKNQKDFKKGRSFIFWKRWMISFEG
jgi:hypothetical protein